MKKDQYKTEREFLSNELKKKTGILGLWVIKIIGLDPSSGTVTVVYSTATSKEEYRNVNTGLPYEPGKVLFYSSEYINSVISNF